MNEAGFCEHHIAGHLPRHSARKKWRLYDDMPYDAQPTTSGFKTFLAPITIRQLSQPVYRGVITNDAPS